MSEPQGAVLPTNKAQTVEEGGGWGLNLVEQHHLQTRSKLSEPNGVVPPTNKA